MTIKNCWLHLSFFSMVLSVRNMLFRFQRIIILSLWYDKCDFLKPMNYMNKTFWNPILFRQEGLRYIYDKRNWQITISFGEIRNKEEEGRDLGGDTNEYYARHYYFCFSQENFFFVFFSSLEHNFLLNWNYNMQWYKSEQVLNVYWYDSRWMQCSNIAFVFSFIFVFVFLLYIS